MYHVIRSILIMSAPAAAAPPVGKHSSIPRPALILHCYMLVGHLNDAFLLFSSEFSCTQPSLFAGKKNTHEKSDNEGWERSTGLNNANKS